MAMKRKCNSWATRKLPPLTVAELERHLDLIASLMDKAPTQAVAEGYLPIWRRVSKELDARKDAEAMLAAARARLTRSPDRTAAQSS